MSAREVVEEMRFVVSEENRERDPDCYFVFIEPVNKLEVKKEVAASEDAEEEVDVCVGMTLAYIDLTGKDAVETDTFDAFVSKKAWTEKVCGSPSQKNRFRRCAAVN